MDYLNIIVPKNIKIAVIGDIHGHLEQFNKIIEKIQPSEKMWVISVGDIKNKGFGIKAENEIISKLQSLNQPACMVRGNNEIKAIREARVSDKMTPELEWLDKLPLTLSFRFHNGTRLTVLHAGVLPHFTENDLRNNIEVAYVRNVGKDGEMLNYDDAIAKKGIPWHDLYDGRFGFIISGHSSSSNNPTYYNYSANIDSCCFGTGVLSSQIFSSEGLEDLIQVKDKAFLPIQIKKEAKKNKSYISKPVKFKLKSIEALDDSAVLNTLECSIDDAL